jgi:hypothetical protein
MSNSAVFGIFSTEEQTATTVDEMSREGFRNADISVLFLNKEDTSDFSSGPLASLARIGVLSNPGLGPFIAAGPLMALLNDANAGTVIGGLTGALTKAGVSETVARRYAARIKRGHILLSVHVDDSKWIRKARKVLKQTGAAGIALTGETEAGEWTQKRLEKSVSG